MPCLQSPKAGEEQTPKCPLHATNKAAESRTEDEHWSDSRYKPAAMRIDWQAENAALRPDSRMFPTRPAGEPGTPRSEPAARSDSNELPTSNRSIPIPFAIGVHFVGRAVCDSFGEMKDQLLRADRWIEMPCRERPLPSASEMTYTINIPSSGSMAR